jgi:hypothetical protein
VAGFFQKISEMADAIEGVRLGGKSDTVRG